VRPTAMRRLVAVGALLALLAGCASASATPAAGPTTPAVTATPTGGSPQVGCPALPKPNPRSGVVVDYVDFVQAHGVTYVADADNTAVLGTADAGPVQFTVRCALGNLNTATHQQPPPARDGDAAFLPSGTQVFALKGWPTSCRLFAQEYAQWRVFVARSGYGTPVACVPTPRTDQPTVATTTGAYGTCHSQQLAAGTTSGQADFVDFVVVGGQTYTGGIAAGQDPGHGKVVLRVRCDFGAFSDGLVGSSTGAVQANGDAAFLLAGTPIYAVKGLRTQCRLTAKADDGWHVYTANGPGCAAPAPIATGLPSSPS